MSRRAARVDANQSAIIKRYESYPGISVADTSRAGDGFPDLVVGCLDVITDLVEVKDGAKIPSQRKLTPAQMKFKAEWRGTWVLVESEDDVDEHVRGMMRRAAWIKGR